MGAPERGLVFVKTHKTAGSTVLNIILRLSIASNLTCTPPANGHSGYGCPRRLPPLRKIRVAKVFAQHVTFEPRLVMRVNPSPLVVTIMREPTSQAVSAYLYPLWAHLRKRVGGANWTDHLARLERDAASALSCHYNNSQAHDMGYASFRSIARTADAYDLVLITEEFDRSLMLLAHMLAGSGWDVDARDLKYAVTNQGRSVTNAREIASMRRLVATSPLLALDLPLYAEARTRLEVKWRASGMSGRPALATCVLPVCATDYVKLMRRCGHT